MSKKKTIVFLPRFPERDWLWLNDNNWFEDNIFAPLEGAVWLYLKKIRHHKDPPAKFQRELRKVEVQVMAAVEKRIRQAHHKKQGK
jgi:hypothetical protein